MTVILIMDITIVSIHGMIRGIIHTGMDGIAHGVTVGGGIRPGIVHGIMEDIMVITGVTTEDFMDITGHLMVGVIHIQIIRMDVVAEALQVVAAAPEDGRP